MEPAHGTKEPQGNGIDVSQKSWIQRTRDFRSRRALPLSSAIILILLCALIYPNFDSLPHSLHLHRGPAPLTSPQDTNRPKHMRLIIPASSGDANLCKTVFSAAALGYPIPVFINWNQTYEDPNLIFGGSHIAKIGGVLEHLQSLPPKADDDLVLIIDGYDVWFQLRPQTLVERYLDITKRQNSRLQGFQQQVIFSAQKRCWPKGPEHPACWAVPNSTLPVDVYGPETDHEVDDEKNPFLKFRQRFLNSGSAIGPVSAIRAIYERASEKAQLDTNIGSDQGIFAEIFGEQEYARRRSEPSLLDWSLDMSRNYEFGLGLDYNSELLQATVFSEYDTAWIRRGADDEVRTAYEEAEIPLRSLDRDPTKASRNSLRGPTNSSMPESGVIHNTANPFETFHGSLEAADWSQVSLFTNLWTGISPIAVHHNAHRDGLKSRREEHWPRLWLQPHLRDLLREHIYSPIQPLASVGEQQWWTHSVRRDGIEFAGGYLPYAELCNNGLETEIFRDDSGPWINPMADL